MERVWDILEGFREDVGRLWGGFGKGREGKGREFGREGGGSLYCIVLYEVLGID